MIKYTVFFGEELVFYVLNFIRNSVKGGIQLSD